MHHTSSYLKSPAKTTLDCNFKTNIQVANIAAESLIPWDVYATLRGKLARIERNEVRELCKHSTFLLLGQSLDYTGHPPLKGDGDPATVPPLRLAEWVLASPNKFPRLAGITSCPVVHANGSLTCAGYDSETELYVAPHVEVAARGLPETPAACAAELLSLVSDFPFVDDRDRGAWLAMVLSALMRPSIPGAVPAFVITATTRGTGKTLLAQAAMEVAHGPGGGISTEPHNEEEAKKAILAEALNGTRFLVWDNLANGRPFGGAVVDSLITSAIVKGRALGGNTLITAKLPFILVCTGNNVRFQADTARRVVLCRLETTKERPEDRQNYAIENLRAHIARNRARILGVAVQLIRLGLASDVKAPRAGSFEEWSATVGKTLVAAGYDLAACFASADGSSDETAEARAELLSYIHRHWPDGCSAQQLLYKAFDPQAPAGCRSEDSNSAVAAIAALSNGNIHKHDQLMQIGRLLSSFKQSNVAGFWMTQVKTNGFNRWHVDKKF